MTDPHEPRSQAEARGCLSVILFVIGVILVAPGACAAIFVAIAWMGHDRYVRLYEPGLMALWVVCFAISSGGLALIWHVLRRTSARRGSR
jgi:hypothetical protein